MSKPIHKDPDFSFVVCCAFRYAKHRHSTAPSIVASFIRKYWDKLDIRQALIYQELKEHLEATQEWKSDTLNSIDYATWQDLYDHLTALHKKRIKKYDEAQSPF